MKTIRYGSRGPDIRKLQEKLTSEGFKIQPTTEFFGTQTDRAVRNFQRKKKLLADGVVGTKTWTALGFSDDDKESKPESNKKPTSKTKTSKVRTLSDDTLNFLVQRLGSDGFRGASMARNAGDSKELAKHPSQLKTSASGMQFIYTREAKRNESNRLHWPKGSSGVTLGPGYDLKERSQAKIIRDITSIGIDNDTAKSIAKGAGLTGAKAKSFCDNSFDLVDLTVKQEMKLLNIITPYYEEQVRKRISINLLQHEFDALVSLAYNLGTVWYRIATPFNQGKVKDGLMQMMTANTSGGKVVDGLTTRRQLEVVLYLFSDYGKLRKV
ncbi:MAG: peptidoglycan-binding protein [Nitrosomonas sp.]|nr:peptidoglycan-binding protein [Nitrosomonas sp.]